MKIKVFTFNPFQENTYVVYDETKEAVVIDPGCSTANEEKEILNFMEKEQLIVKHLINTHCHIDHVLGVNLIASKFNLELQIHKNEQKILEAVPAYASMYGMSVAPFSGTIRFIDEGDQIKFGHTVLKVVFVPGHAPGHLVFINEKEKIIFGGDVLFYGSIGRTDLPGGDHETLIRSIKTKILSLSDDYTVYSGHGPKTNVGFERKNNPFLN